MHRDKIQKSVRETYGKIASESQKGCGCSCGEPDAAEFAGTLGYTKEDLQGLPDEANLALSCGNPIALAELKEGESVLDLGSGAGFDCFIAARKVGDKGRVIGVDMTPEMIEKARANAEQNGIDNVEFRPGEIENLPLPESSVDVVISNCVINLSVDKLRVFREIYRVLKPGGRLAISDIVLLKELPEKIRENMNAYTACVSGALHIDRYVEHIRDAGFKELEVEIGRSTICLDNDEDSLADVIASANIKGYK